MHPWSALVAEIDAAPTARVGLVTRADLMRADELAWLGVSQSPVELHKASGLERNLYAVARCIASEIGGAGEALLSVAECLRNEAKVRGVDPYALLTFGTSAAYAWTRGKYGEQKGRFASTRQDPTRRTAAAARAALSTASNLTNGGARWLSLDVMDGGKQGSGNLRYDAHGIVDKWSKDGWAWIGPLPRVASYRHSVFRRLSVAQSNDALHRIIDLGRAGAATVGAESPDPATADVARTGVPGWLLVGVGAAAAFL